MNYTDTTALSALIDTVYSKVAILTAQAHADFFNKPWFEEFNLAQYGPGSTIKVPVYAAIAAASGVLSETTNGNGISLSATTADITLAEYGNFTTLTEKANFTAVDAPAVQAVTLMGENMGRSLDAVFYNVFKGGTNVIYGGDATTTNTIDAADTFSVDSIIKGVKELKENAAPTFEDGMYVLYISPKQASDLKQDSDFRSSVIYSAYSKIERGYIGDFQGCHVVESPNITGTSNGAVDVYSGFMFGLHALGVGKAYAEKIVIKEPVDALERFSTVGWKALTGAARLVEAYLVRIESS